MSVVIKQLLINQIKLPMDMINIIKDYCFYNIEEMTKKNKLLLHRVITSAEYTRANKFNNDPDYSDDDPHWSFGFATINPFNEVLQLQGYICSYCGNFQRPYTNIYLEYCVECKCEDYVQELLEFEDYDSHDEEDDFDP